MTEIQIEQRDEAGETCREILAELPRWFGIEEVNESYARAADEHVSLVAVDGDIDVGIITIVRHAERSAEVHLLAVRPGRHREGVGTKLLQTAEAHLRGRGVRFLQVKTLAPAQPDDEYAQTHAFYRARGFVTLQDLPDLGDVENPARQMIKTIFPAGLVEVPDPGLPWDLLGFSLRRWREDDWPAIVAACDDEAIRRFTMMPHGISEARARVRAANAADAWNHGFPNVAIADERDRVVGTVHWMPREVPGNAEAAYWVLPEARGRGWVPSALRHMTNWAFTHAGIERMEVLVDLDNEASQRAAEKAGFVREGIRRGYEEVPGRDTRSDLWCFARLSTD